ncbi:hypothetical protein D9615_008087 [Tricholomella constricta]|uniref:Uncharacterized protein n=1 Tax=Tricholomella constricta TaxID=117010 RepID=A0A8H5GVX3_9AGAR|nr:hypothetical protein D9615_008087 [Tricholomella constricta]
MIHIDRNHLPSPNLISDKIGSWSKPFDTFITEPPADVASVPGPVTPLDSHDPVVSHTSSPASPADGNTASPTRDRSSSLSPPPETAADSPPAKEPELETEEPLETLRKEEEEEDEVRVEQASRQSTPLSELSPPPPDQDDEQEPAAAVKAEEDEVKPVEQPVPQPEPKLESTSSIQSPATPTNPIPISPLQSNDPKVVSTLELNLELLRVCMEFQSRGIPISEPRFSQYSARLQSNLAWLAAAADHSRVGNHSNVLLPPMDPPPTVKFGNMERIQQLYADLPSIFAKEIARRHQMGVIPTLPNSTLKRDRPDEAAGDTAVKRRNTGDSKPPLSTTMPPPPSIPNAAPMTQFSLPMANGAAHPHTASPQLSEAQIASLNPGLLSNPADAQLAASHRERARQAQIRAAQQQAARQMSPPQGQGQGQLVPTSSNPNVNVNAAAGPSNLGGGGGGRGMPDANVQQQLFRILQTPNHPFIQYMMRMVPGFETLPLQQQMQKMLFAQASLQRQQQQQAQAPAQHVAHMRRARLDQVMPMQRMPQQQQPMAMNTPGAGASMLLAGLGPNPAPSSPRPPQSPMSQQNSGRFSMEGGGGDGGGANDLPPGININNLSPHQRQQLILMQQQSRFGGGGGGGAQNPMLMNAQQQQQQQQHQQQQQQQQHSYVQEQQWMREQQQRMAQAQAQAQQAGSPTIPGSPMHGDGGFPALRSNASSSIPGIARSTRSPSDGAASPMTPRVPTRGSSLGQEDYQRLMQQQQAQQMQGQRAMSAGSPVYGNPQQQQQQMAGGGWQGSHGQHQGMQMGLGQQQQQGPSSSSSYGMSSPGSAGAHGGPYGGGGGGNAPSPSSSQSWTPSHGNYPFAPSPGAGAAGAHQSDHNMQMQQQLRHMSGTPGPQQQQQMQPQNASPAMEQPMSSDFDLFNWGGQ